MSTKVPCYVRTLRRQWGLTQEEVGFLLPRGNRNRVSCVERGVSPPNAEEILAYRVIFGSSAKATFPRFYEETEDLLMQHAYQFYKRLKGDKSADANRRRELIEQMFARAAKKVSRTKA